MIAISIFVGAILGEILCRMWLSDRFRYIKPWQKGIISGTLVAIALLIALQMNV